MHPFTKSGLGSAPFRCVGVRKNAYQACHGAPVQPGGSCNHCGTGIMYEYIIRNAEGGQFVVGSDCVMKTGGEGQVEGFRAERLKLAREQRAEKCAATQAIRAAERAARAEQQKVDTAADRAKFAENFPVFLSRLETDTSDFGRDLLGKLNSWGSLSIAQMGAMQTGWDRADKRAAEKANSQHIGKVGERVAGTFTVVHRTTRIASQFPPIVSHWHLMTDSDGNVCTYRGSKLLGDRGDTVEGKFSVKEHTEYQGTRQTVLARPALTAHKVAA